MPWKSHRLSTRWCCPAADRLARLQQLSLLRLKIERLRDVINWTQERRWKQFNYSQASNAKCLTSMFYCEASEGFRRFALLCVDSIYFGAVKRHWHCMCLHRKIFVHPFGLIRWPFNFI